jgi:hypothetical protein
VFCLSRIRTAILAAIRQRSAQKINKGKKPVKAVRHHAHHRTAACRDRDEINVHGNSAVESLLLIENRLSQIFDSSADRRIQVRYCRG